MKTPVIKKELLTRNSIQTGANLRIINIFWNKMKKDNDSDDVKTLRELLGIPNKKNDNLTNYFGKNKVYDMLNGFGKFPANTAMDLEVKTGISSEYFLGERLLLKAKIDYPRWQEFFEAKQKVIYISEGIDQAELQNAKEHAKELEKEIEEIVLAEIMSNALDPDLNIVSIFLEQSCNIFTRRFDNIKTNVQQIDFERVCKYDNSMLIEYENALSAHLEMIKTVMKYREYESK